MIRILTLFLLMAGGAQAQQAISCILRPAAEIEIAPPVAGLLEDLTVDRGDAVTKGQELGRIMARVEEAQLEAARRRAESTASIDARRAQVDDALRRLEQMQALKDRGVASQNQLDDLIAEVSVVGSQLVEAEDSQLAAKLEVVAAQAALDQRVITSPVSGLVLARHLDPGEFAAADEALLEIVTVSTLHAEVVLPDTAYGSVAAQDKVLVTANDLQRGGTIDAVDPIIDAASRSFGLRVVIDNSDKTLTAGSRCDVQFDAE